VALGEKHRKRGLHGGAEGEIGVGDDFEPIERGTNQCVGAGDREPGDFHLGEGRDFRKAAESEGERFGVGGESFAGRGVEGEVEEHFVDDEREIVFLAERVEAGDLFGLHVGTRGIVGMNEQDGTCARGDGAFERLKINEPAVGVGKRVGNQANILEIGEKFEERVAGLGEKELVTGIAEKAEDVGIGFAGAGGKKKRFGIDGGLMVVEVVASDFAAGGEGTFGLRVIGESGRILKGGKDSVRIVMKAAFCGVGSGEVEDGNASGAEFVDGESESIGGERPVGAGGEHGESLVVSFWRLVRIARPGPTADSVQRRGRIGNFAGVKRVRYIGRRERGCRISAVVAFGILQACLPVFRITSIQEDPRFFTMGWVLHIIRTH